LHAFADGAVLVASALIFGLVALNAEHRAGGHRSLLEQTLPEPVALRQVQQRDEFASCCHNRTLQKHILCRFAPTLRPSLTGLGARASIGFLPEKTEWNPS
jgi:hypothetical protein